MDFETGYGKEQSLRGLNAIYLAIEEFHENAQAYGLSKNYVRSDIEGLIKASGLLLVTRDDLKHLPGRPFLRIMVNAVDSGQGIFACSVNVSLNQLVGLLRDPLVECFAPTWESSSNYVLGSANLQEIHNVIREKVKKFLDEYRDVNEAT